ncbi:MAG: DUF2752 domain-containing protein [Bacteroidales bacterium]|nr:DUF2752 domain-containing protein [Bacteroidales bacterium]
MPLKNNPITEFLKVRVRNEPYLIINIFFAGVIALIFAYSGIFSPEKNNYPVACIHEQITGEQCISCGLSHSFSLIVRGRIEEAYQWNMYGMRVFLFFAAQLILRIRFSLSYINNKATQKELIITDCLGSGLIFLIAFWPYIAKIVSDIF